MKAKNQATAEKLGAAPLSSFKLREKIESASLDVCDQCEIIKMAVEKLDNDEPAATAALLRSIQCFNDAIFRKLTLLEEELSGQPPEGGAA